MKLKAVESICKSSKTVIIYRNDRCQWIGNGTAFYPMDEFPEITTEDILSIFDVSEDKREKFFCKYETFPNGINLEGADENEILLDRDLFDVFYDGKHLLPLKTPTGIIFIQKKLLKPFGEDTYELYLRELPSGTPYVVVKSGWFLLGAIAPVLLNNDEFIKKAEDLLKFSKLRLENYKKENGDNAEDPEETLI